MPVFISHRTADDEKAQALASRLRSRHNITSYLDHFDPETESTRNITALLLRRIDACTHLLALITSSTRDSWWVPFEIGVARKADRRITSFRSGYVTLPEYLTEWPVLASDADLDTFAEKYHRDRAAKPIIERHAAYARTILSADDFHSELKRALRAR